LSYNQDLFLLEGEFMTKEINPVGSGDLQNKLVEILTSIQGAVGEAKDFTIQQLPDVAQQYITYGTVYHTGMSLFSALIMLVSCYAVYKMITWKDGVIRGGYDHGDWLPVRTGVFTFSGIIAFVSGLSFFAGIKETMIVLFAPKVWLLMEIAKLVK
jgi:hypothetical protein